MSSVKSNIYFFVMLLFLVICSQSFGTDKAISFQPQILNVILIEIDTNLKSRISEPVLNDWPYWNKNAGKLISRLNNEFGHTLATNEGQISESSLFAIKTSAINLDDIESLTPIANELDIITLKTGRPSFMLVWMKRQGDILLSFVGTEGINGFVALNILSYLQTDSPGINLISTSASTYIVPPAVLTGETTSPFANQDSNLELLLNEKNIETFLHSLAACEYLISIGISKDEFKQHGPAGTAMLQVVWNAVKTNPIQANVNQYMRVLRNASPSLQQQSLNIVAQYAQKNPEWAEKLDGYFSRGLGWKNPVGAKRPQLNLASFAAKGDLSDAEQEILIDNLIRELEGLYAKGLSGTERAKEIEQLIEAYEKWKADGKPDPDKNNEKSIQLHASKGVFGGTFGEWVRKYGRIVTGIGGLFGDPVPPVLEPQPPKPDHEPGPSKWPPGLGDLQEPGGFGIGKPPKDREKPKKPKMSKMTIAERDTGLIADPIPEPDTGLIADPIPEPDIGIVASTTGPGKRGGRGGGITRPPSWNPPGNTGKPPSKPQPKPGEKKMVTSMSTAMTMPSSIFWVNPPKIHTIDITPSRKEIPMHQPLFPERPHYIYSTPTSQLGGIMLAPNLEITVDKEGFTSKTVNEAVASVKGNKTGGEITIDGKKTIVVRAPGSEKLLQVPIGKYHLWQQDISISGNDSHTVSLHRFYDSTSNETSPIGKGWSLLPYSLQVSYFVDVANGKLKAARKAVLVDRHLGIELAYQLEKKEDSNSTELPSYRSMTSSLQPELSLRTDGGYIVAFAHGLEVAFDPNGRLQWLGFSEYDRVNYIFTNQQLTSITNKASAIDLHYDRNGNLTAAKGSNGQEVTFHLVLDTLESVNRIKGEKILFTYDNVKRIATVTSELNNGKRNLVFDNTFDNDGRLLTQRTPQGEWQFQYDDQIGRVVVKKGGSKETEYYYDGSQRLVAYGSSRNDMTLLNYDVTGRILQVAKGEMLNDPSDKQRPRFRVSKLITPLPPSMQEQNLGES